MLLARNSAVCRRAPAGGGQDEGHQKNCGQDLAVHNHKLLINIKIRGGKVNSYKIKNQNCAKRCRVCSRLGSIL
ncbi:MAG: winged helix-turn-helix domain-containing protein [Eubacteriales bacterium]